MEVIYVRISTANQNAERQMKQEGKNYKIDVCSGTVPFAERPNGKKLITLAKQGKINQIEVKSIDRLGRNLGDILNTIKTFSKYKVCLYIKDQEIKTMVKGEPNPTADLIINIMASVSEFERKTIKERTKEGIAIAKAKKKYKGRPKGAKTPDKKLEIRHKERIQIIQSKLSEGKSILSIANEFGYNRGLIYRLIDRKLITIKTQEDE